MADGKGKFTEGTWSLTIDAPGTHVGCKLTMTSGTYSVNSNGTGSENTKWQLVKSDSSPDCLTFFPDTGEVPTSETQLIVKDPTGAVFYSTNISFFAVAAIAYQK